MAAALAISEDEDSIKQAKNITPIWFKIPFLFTIFIACANRGARRAGRRWQIHMRRYPRPRLGDVKRPADPS